MRPGGLVAVGDAQPLRSAVAIAHDRAPDERRAAWVAFLRDAGAGAAWRAAWHQGTGVPSRAPARGNPAPPLVRPGSLSVRPALRVCLEADQPRARYEVFVDGETGDVIAAERLLRFAGGHVDFESRPAARATPARSAARPRTPRAARAP